MAGQRSRRHHSVTSEVRALHSPDICQLQSDAPHDITNFGILVQALVGPSGEPGEESFDVVVCTPAWLAQELSQSEYLYGRHHLIVERYDYCLIRRALDETFGGVTGATWAEVAERLARFGHWEFEDYRQPAQESA